MKKIFLETVVAVGMAFPVTPLLGQEVEFDRESLVLEVEACIKALNDLSGQLDASATALTLLNLGLILTNYENNKHVCAALTDLQNAITSMQESIPQIRTKAMKAKFMIKNAKSVDDLLEAYEMLNQIESDIDALAKALDLDDETKKALGAGAGAISILQEVLSSTAQVFRKTNQAIENILNN